MASLFSGVFGKKKLTYNNVEGVQQKIHNELMGDLDPRDLGQLREALNHRLEGKKIREHITDLYEVFYKEQGRSNVPKPVPDPAMMLWIAQLLCSDPEYTGDTLSDAELSTTIAAYCDAPREKKPENFAPEEYSHLGPAVASKARGNGGLGSMKVYTNPTTGMTGMTFTPSASGHKGGKGKTRKQKKTRKQRKGRKSTHKGRK